MTERLAEQIRRLGKAHSPQPARRAAECRKGVTRELVTDLNMLQAVTLIETISSKTTEKTT